MGCTSIANHEIKPITANFECEFEIENSELSGTMTINSDQSIIFEVYTPQNIHGTKISVSDSNFIVDIGGISKTYEKQNQDNDITPFYIHNVFKSLKNFDVLENSDSFFIDGTCESGKFTFTLNSSGQPLKLELKDNNQTFIFNNFSSNSK